MIMHISEWFSQKEKVKGKWRNLHKEQLLDLSFKPSNIWGDQHMKKEIFGE